MAIDCPSCGGAVLGIDGDDTARCAYCHRGLILLRRRRIARFYYPALPADRMAAAGPLELWYAPYYRLRALELRWTVGLETSRPMRRIRLDPQEDHRVGEAELPERNLVKRFHGRVVNLALADQQTRALNLPPLGVKPWLLPLTWLGSAGVGSPAVRFVRRGSSWPAVEAELRARALGRTDGGAGFEPAWSDSRLVRPRLDLIYAPYYRSADGSLYDGTSGLPVGHLRVAPPDQSPDAADADLSVGSIEVAACPSCRADLAAARFAAAARCPACGRVWELTDEGLRPALARFARGAAAEQRLYLPFWRFGMRWRAPPPLRVPDRIQTVHVPGYGAYRAPRLDVIARDLNRLQPRWVEEPRPEGQLGACFVGAQEAHDLAFAHAFGSVRVPAPRALPALSDLRLELDPPELWLLPFRRLGRELHGLAHGGRYARAMLGLGDDDGRPRPAGYQR
jgi:predicted RNA-binding Zn-ribbon protein involved in translation (DUF1610 family)